MKGISIVAIAATLLSSSPTSQWGVEGIHLHERSDGGAPRVVGMPIGRRKVADPVKRDRLRRRDGSVQVTLDNEETLYFANATIGTPAQGFRLHIDTGSSDLWVNTNSSALCRSRTRPCNAAGIYSANTSSTYSYISSDFSISYVDGSGAAGDYVSDTFSIGDISLSRLQFGIGYNSTSSQGILGIGYPINEVQVGRVGKPAYNNLPAQMVADGLIQSNAYSLWLNDLDASTGSILFGGVDTAQYVGSLASLPVQPCAGEFSEFLITLTGVQLGSTVIASNQAQAVLLDSGSSLTYLPDAITAAIYSLVGAQYDPTAGAAYVPCSLASEDESLTFTFSSPTITVPMNELVIPIFSTSGRPLTFSDGTTACLFGVAPAGSSTSVLGDTFLRSAYVVYDLENNEISLAQTNFNATDHNVVEIGKGVDSVPDAALVTDSVTALVGVGSSADDNASPTVTLSAGSGVGGATSVGAAPAERTAMPMMWSGLAVAGMVLAAM